jgi:preprotein translocase subunit SecA
VLNAKYHEQEATIIAQAGRKGAVTVATNMAGRGTDIMLGGNPEFIADAELHQRGLSPVDTPGGLRGRLAGGGGQGKAAVAAEHEEVVAAGGLYVLGTERHESRRIDNQLRGRSGRQGDPGESRFYLSLEDDLMRMFNGAGRGDHGPAEHPEDVPIESVVSRAIRSAQTQVESQNFEIRKDVLKYDDVLNRQRTVIYASGARCSRARPARAGPAMIDEVVASYVDARPPTATRGMGPRPALDGVQAALPDHADDRRGDRGGRRRQGRSDRRVAHRDGAGDAQGAYDRREEELTPEVMREIERRVVLSVIDRKWREHLYEMDYLREGIGLRAMAQRDPLVEYQREGFDMFNAMMDGIKEESVGNLFNLQFEIQENPIVEEVGAGAQLGFGGALPGVTTHAAGSAPQDVEEVTDTVPESTGPQPVMPVGLEPNRPRHLQYSAPTEDGGVEMHGDAAEDPYATVGRNDLCPCGSGRKYKRCHGSRNS